MTALAKRVGGGKSPSLQFAYRFANYFSNRHPYSYFVDIPNGDGHPVVRWLKTESPGLCSNYAAAFTLLARSRGIPTRVVSGFASNEFDQTEKRYVLRQNNAHAWVEFLDESNRWIRFDPTPGISEAEVRKAQSFVTQATPNRLQQLLQAQSLAVVDEEEPEIAQTDTQNLSDAESLTPASGNPKASDETPASEPQPIAEREPSPNSKPIANQQTPRSKRSPSNRFPDDSLTPEHAIPEATSSAPNPAENETDGSPISSTATSSNAPGSPPWLLLLLVLVLVIPAIAFAFSKNRARNAPPQLQLRFRAGRLLTQLDSLIHKHELDSDPVWADTRSTLAAQRYGREANSILIQDIAVKIGLLAKRKPNSESTRRP